jgi:hypothetical protein
MLPKMKFFLLHFLCPVNLAFMHINNEVLQSYNIGLNHYLPYKIITLESLCRDVDPVIQAIVNTMIFKLRLSICFIGSWLQNFFVSVEQYIEIYSFIIIWMDTFHFNFTISPRRDSPVRKYISWVSIFKYFPLIMKEYDSGSW